MQHSSYRTDKPWSAYLRIDDPKFHSQSVVGNKAEIEAPLRCSLSKTNLVFQYPPVCSEPVLVKRSFLQQQSSRPLRTLAVFAPLDRHDRSSNSEDLTGALEDRPAPHSSARSGVCRPADRAARQCPRGHFSQPLRSRRRRRRGLSHVLNVDMRFQR